MPNRDFPYGAFNFLVNINSPGVDPATPLGGFSDVTGISTDITVAEYRNGNEPENHPRKIAGAHKVGDVTLKRGVINSADLWAWITQVRTQGRNARRDVTITMRGEDGSNVQSWQLRNVIPLKYTGPSLAAKGGTDVAMEELVLSAEGLEIVAA
jgi:phage tail-like protein